MTEQIWVQLLPDTDGRTDNMRVKFTKSIGMQRELRLVGYTATNVNLTTGTHLMMNISQHVESSKWIKASTAGLVNTGVPLPLDLSTGTTNIFFFPHAQLPLLTVPGNLTELVISVTTNFMSLDETPLFTEMCLWMEAVPI